MAKILGELDLPAGCAQTRQFIAHEERPHTLLSEAIGIFRRPSEGVQHVARDFLEAGVGQLVHPLLFERSPTFDLDRFATLASIEKSRASSGMTSTSA
jgi:hypothetical protein